MEPVNDDQILLDLKYCAECVDDFYNHDGNSSNPVGCWCREGATFETYRLIPINLRPPYNHIEIQELPTCYKRKHHVKIKPEALTKEGFWK